LSGLLWVDPVLNVEWAEILGTYYLRMLLDCPIYKYFVNVIFNGCILAFAICFVVLLVYVTTFPGAFLMTKECLSNSKKTNMKNVDFCLFIILYWFSQCPVFMHLCMQVGFCWCWEKCSLSSRNLLIVMWVPSVVLLTQHNLVHSSFWSSKKFDISSAMISFFSISQRVHIIQTITTPSESLLKELQTVEVCTFKLIFLIWKLEITKFLFLFKFMFLVSYPYWCNCMCVSY